MMNRFTLAVVALAFATSAHASPFEIAGPVGSGCYDGPSFPTSSWEYDGHLRVNSFRSRTQACPDNILDQAGTWFQLYEVDGYTRVTFSTAFLTADDMNGWNYQLDMEAGDFSTMVAILLTFPAYYVAPVLPPAPPTPPTPPSEPPAAAPPYVPPYYAPPSFTPPISLIPDTPPITEPPSTVPDVDVVPVPEPTPLSCAVMGILLLGGLKRLGWFTSVRVK